MSRIGKKPIPIPKGVTVKIAPDAIEVQGPKGKMRQPVPPGILFAQDEGALVAKLERDEDGELRKFHGLARSLVANAVAGVTDGFKKELDIVGVGYRAELKGKQVHFALGYSHPVVFDIPTGIDIAVDKQTHIVVTGVDRQLVGRSEEHTSELQSRLHLVCRLLLEKKKHKRKSQWMTQTQNIQSNCSPSSIPHNHRNLLHSGCEPMSGPYMCYACHHPEMYTD